uniref:DUF438 domain-containing protein n=1 Tax=candidate division WOR-3 bacterium TaxID=2052148 RepID=A0A7C6ECS9_UNCW3
MGKNKKALIKEMIRQLHKGADPNKIKEEFKDVLKDISPAEIAQIEEELIKEGMAPDEIRRLCEVHLALFRESLEQTKTIAPAGHPIHTLMEEHKIMLGFANELVLLAKEMKKAKDWAEVPGPMEHLNHIVKHFKDSEKHYLREENVLFPYLEKHGITQPPKIMWMEHDKIREIKKGLYLLLTTAKDTDFNDFVMKLTEVGVSLAEVLSSHFTKENNILFPTTLQVIEATEWEEIRQQFGEIGYCCFTPESAVTKEAVEVKVTKKVEVAGGLDLDTGVLRQKEIIAIFNSLPVDITFVDANDEVRYFNQTKDRIFVRTKAVLGRKVQQCHPQKSIHIVNQILEDFRNKKRDVAEFWISLQGRLVYIRYFPVWDNNGNYLGCIEVTQDVTDIKKLEGEKRLL